MKLYLALISLLMLAACSDENAGTSDTYLPDANGQHGEILLLLDDQLWEGAVGEAVITSLTQHARGPYLRPEPMFSYFRKQPNDLNHLNQLNRNMLKLMVDNDSTYAETAIIEKNNYYAKNQLFVIVKDSDPNRLLEYATNRMDYIIDLFNDFEEKQLVRQYTKEPNKALKERAEKNFGISVSFPKDTEFKAEKENFLLMRHDRSKNLLPNDANKARGGVFWVQQGFMIWSVPYDPAKDQLSAENILHTRDSVLKKNVAGRVKDTYMATEYDPYYKPEANYVNVDGVTGVEIRGLWKHDGVVFTGGGGPFVQYTFLHEARNEVVTVCGYVYAPKFEKREYIRELGAVMKTIDIVE